MPRHSPPAKELSLEPLERLLADLRWGAVVVDAAHRVLWRNVAFQKMFPGCRVRRGQSIHSLLQRIAPNRDHREALEHSLNVCVEQRQTEHLPLLLFQTPDDRQLEVNVACVSINLGGAAEPLIAIMFEEIGPAMMSRRMFESLFDSSPDGIIVFDRERRIVMINKALERMTQWSREELAANEILCSQLTSCQTENGVSMKGALCPMLEMAQPNSSGPIKREMVFRRRDGGELYVEVQYYPVRDNWGELRYIMSIVRDQTRQKETEHELAESRQLASLGLLIAGIAHELKNPLGSIMSAAEIIANPQRGAMQKRQAANFLKEEAKRMDRVIREFLAFARPRRSEFVQTDFNDFLRGAMRGLHDSRPEAAPVKLVFKLDQDLPPAWIDPEQLRQALLNLYLNALDALGPDGGRITIATSQARGQLLCTFSDNGCGVAQEDLTLVFDPFFTRKSSGVGLGLAIVNKIMLAHHGRITVESKEGKGATFTIRLPLSPPESIPAPPPATGPPPATEEGIPVAFESGAPKRKKRKAPRAKKAAATKKSGTKASTRRKRAKKK